MSSGFTGLQPDSPASMFDVVPIWLKGAFTFILVIEAVLTIQRALPIEGHVFHRRAKL